MKLISINPKIDDILSEHPLFAHEYSRSQAKLYILALYFDLSASEFPSRVRLAINSCSRILRVEDNSINWQLDPVVSLVKDSGDPFDWVVEEYLPLFANVGYGNKYKRESTARMRKLFSENPEVRKDEVLQATRMMLRDTDPRYVRRPHYFLSKGIGAERIQDVLSWVDKYHDYQEHVQAVGGPNPIHDDAIKISR